LQVFSELSRRKPYEQFHTVGLILCLMRGAVAVELTAFGASVNNNVALSRVGLNADRFHFPLAFAGAISGVDVYVKRPQAKGTVIARGVAQGVHLLAAMRADKAVVIFCKSLLLHGKSPFDVLL
jgi:hypothetical protein